jgi:hypothetical protein
MSEAMDEGSARFFSACRSAARHVKQPSTNPRRRRSRMSSSGRGVASWPDCSLESAEIDVVRRERVRRSSRVFWASSSAPAEADDALREHPCSGSHRDASKRHLGGCEVRFAAVYAVSVPSAERTVAPGIPRSPQILKAPNGV